jgi:hypothetical protein
MNTAPKTRLLVLGCFIWIAFMSALLFGRTVGQQPSVMAEPAVPFSKGRLETLDIAHNALTIQTKNGRQTFRLTVQTKIFHGKEGLALDQLKTGDVVAVRFVLDEHGDRVARIIKLDLSTEPSPLDAGATASPHPAGVHP